MTVMTRRRSYAAFLACVPVLLSSCTDTGEPVPAASTASRTPSATRTATAPTASPTPTATSPDSIGTVVVAAGDIACDPVSRSYVDGEGTATACRQKATSDVVIGLKPAAVFALGDIQYEVGRLAAFRTAYDTSWGRFKDITWPTPGNHEYGTGVTRGYFEYFGPRAGTRKRSWYSTDIGGWHVISLNSNCAQIDGCQRGSPQENWLRADLASNKAKCTLAIMHQPRWTSGLHGPGTKVDGLWRALAEGGADVVLAGHDHHYERFAPIDAAGKVDAARGVRSFVVGTGGVDLYPVIRRAQGSEVIDVQTFGVLKLTLRPAAYSWEFVPVPGRTFSDSGNGSCH